MKRSRVFMVWRVSFGFYAFATPRSWPGIAAGVLTPSTPPWKTRIVMPCQSASAEQTNGRLLLDCVGQEPLAFSANPLVAMSFSNDRRYHSTHAGSI